MTDNSMTENSQEWKMENRTMTDRIAEVNTMGQDTDRQVKSSQVAFNELVSYAQVLHT